MCDNLIHHKIILYRLYKTKIEKHKIWKKKKLTIACSFYLLKQHKPFVVGVSTVLIVKTYEKNSLIFCINFIRQKRKTNKKI